MLSELQYRSLIVGLVTPGSAGRLEPFEPDALHNAYRQITADHPYADFRLMAGGHAAQLSNGPQDFVTLDPRLLQVKTDILLTPAMAQAKTTAVLKLAARCLKQHAFTQCSIQINAQTPTPGGWLSARSFVTDELMGASAQANLLGPEFFGCLQFRHTQFGMEQQLSIEPLLTDDSFVFVTLDIQRSGPEDDLDELQGWLLDAFGFMRDRATRLLEARTKRR